MRKRKPKPRPPSRKILNLSDLPGKIHGDVLAELTGLSDRRVREIAKEGYCQPPVKAMYDLVPTIQGLFKQAREVRETRGDAFADVKLAREQDRARQERVAADLAEGKAVDKAEARQIVTRAFLDVKFKALGVGKKLAQRLSLLTDPIEIEQLLNSEMREMISDAKFDYGFLPCPECGKKVI